MSISTDNVRQSLKPDSLNISWLFKIGLSLGIMNMIEGVLFTMALLSYFGLSGSVNRLYTFTFAYLVLTGLFTLMIVRERNHFWESRPSTLLIITMVGEILLVIVISLFGFLELAPLGYMTLFGILGYVLFVSFLINDPIKVYLIRTQQHHYERFQSKKQQKDSTMLLMVITAYRQKTVIIANNGGELICNNQLDNRNSTVCIDSYVDGWKYWCNIDMKDCLADVLVGYFPDVNHVLQK
jgi:hypothetical protein